MDFFGLGKCILFEVIFILLVTYQAKADLSNLVDQCCHQGTEWSKIDDQCYDYSRPIAGIPDDKQAMCTFILDVCCLKNRQRLMCEAGKSVATRGVGRCSVRSDKVGAATHKECCNCCKLGNAAREMGMGCTAPGIGNPCDLTFMECCTGITDNPEPSGNATDISDIDECEVFSDRQLCTQGCVNTYGSYRCECDAGFTLASDGRTCYQTALRGCARGNNCSHQCRDMPNGQMICMCREGYSLASDGVSCEDIDECSLVLDNCRSDQQCVNTDGNFTCELAYTNNCARGFVFDELRGRCVPEPDPSRRQCDSGFAYNTVTRQCEDIDECIVQRHDCRGPNEACRNLQGSFYCDCDDGWRRNTRLNKCEDIDECGMQVDTCTASERCENSVGSYTCRRLTPCGTGWTLDDETQQCTDQNECESGTHNCRAGYECFNIEGSFRCNPKKCPQGYRFDSGSMKCEPVNCPRGLKADSASLCVDIDECVERPNVCRDYQQCMNTYGGYRCNDPRDCGPGYELDDSGTQCMDIDECEKGTHNCESGSVCMNRRGSFLCSCPPGYRRVAGRCVDKDECRYGLCPFNSRCENTEGGYTCICNPGLEKKDKECVDVDECQDPNRCHHKCINMVGSFQCTCNTGYQLSPTDQRTCIDIDECRQFGTRGRLCGGDCINTPGSYQCTCPAGWVVLGNGRSCQDVNECDEGSDSCGSSSDVMCFNTRGSHKCPRIVCPPGFSRSSLGPRRNSVRCKRLSFTCRSGDDECLNAPLSLSSNFLTFPTNVKVPTDLFSMSGPQTTEKRFDWSLNITSVHPLQAGVRPVQRSDFDLKIGRNDAVVSLQNEITGAQDIELMLTMKITDRYSGYTGYAYSNIFFGVIVDVDDILCEKNCEWFDTPCMHNETMSVSYQFMALPSIAEVKAPIVLLNVTALNFILVPQIFLHIMSGNEGNWFDTVVLGEMATFRLLRPLKGPDEHYVMLRLENRDYIGNKIISAHNTHITIDVSKYEF